MADTLSLVTISFLIVSVFTFALIVHAQSRLLDNETSRLVVLSTRTAMAFPLFSVFIYVSIPIPAAYAAMEVLIAVVLGYTFYAFLVLMVTNMGGPNETVDLLNRSIKVPLWHSCCPTDRQRYYETVCTNVFSLLTLRVAVMAVAAVLYYVDTQISTLVYVLLKVFALMLMVHGLASVVSFCEQLRTTIFSSIF